MEKSIIQENNSSRNHLNGSFKPSARAAFMLPLGGKKAHASAVLFQALRQPSLTEKAKPVPLKITNTLLMGKLRQGVMAVAAGLALAGCSEANAEDKENSTKAETQQMAAVTEVQVGTCSHIDDFLEKMKCENALKRETIKKQEAEIATIDKATEEEKSTGEELDTTYDVLINEIGNQAIQESPQR